MRVCIINNAWPSTSVGNYISNIVRCFKKWNKSVDMLYLQNKIKIREEKGIKILTSPFRFPIGMSELNNYFYFPNKLPLNYDIFHMSNETIATCCKRAKPSVITCADIVPVIFPNEYNYITNYFRRLQIKNLKYADRIIVPSKNTKNDILKHLNINPEKIEIIHYGVYSKKFKPMDKYKCRELLGLDVSDKLIINVGWELPRKNNETLFKVIYEINKKMENVKLLKIGGINKGKELIKRLNIENHVIDIGFAPDELLPLYYNAADILLFPSYYEGFGLPILESMACGIPVVASNSSSIPEIIGHGGILFDPFDVNGFVKAIYDILTNEDLSKELAKKALKRSKEFSWKECAKETWKVYKDVI